MAVRPKPLLNDYQLPAAVLYLDDVERIVDVMVAAMATSADGDAERPQVSFETEEEICDEVSDLRQLGGRSNDFEIHCRVRHYSDLRLDISKYWAKIDGPRAAADKAWADVWPIFNARKSRFRAFAKSNSGQWVCGAAGALAVFSALVAISAASPVSGLALACLAGISAAVGVAIYRSATATVLFTYKRDHAGSISAAWAWVRANVLGKVLAALTVTSLLAFLRWFLHGRLRV